MVADCLGLRPFLFCYAVMLSGNALGNEGESRETVLTVFGLKNGEVQYLGTSQIGMLGRGDNVYVLPTNPDNLLLYTYDGETDSVYSATAPSAIGKHRISCSLKISQPKTALGVRIISIPNTDIDLCVQFHNECSIIDIQCKIRCSRGDSVAPVCFADKII